MDFTIRMGHIQSILDIKSKGLGLKQDNMRNFFRSLGSHLDEYFLVYLFFVGLLLIIWDIQWGF